MLKGHGGRGRGEENRGQGGEREGDGATRTPATAAQKTEGKEMAGRRGRAKEGDRGATCFLRGGGQTPAAKRRPVCSACARAHARALSSLGAAAAAAGQRRAQGAGRASLFPPRRQRAAGGEGTRWQTTEKDRGAGKGGGPRLASNARRREACVWFGGGRGGGRTVMWLGGGKGGCPGVYMGVDVLPRRSLFFVVDVF